MAQKDKKAEKTGLPFGPRNYMLMGAALVMIIIGYFSLNSGSITLAPILLDTGSCLDPAPSTSLSSLLICQRTSRLWLVLWSLSPLLCTCPALGEDSWSEKGSGVGFGLGVWGRSPHMDLYQTNQYVEKNVGVSRVK